MLKAQMLHNWSFTAKESTQMDALRNLLLAASSQDPTGLANAENQLKTLEIQPGFHAALLVSLEKKSNTQFLTKGKIWIFQSSAADQSLNSGARLQAILYLKNGIDKYWRKTAPK